MKYIDMNYNILHDYVKNQGIFTAGLTISTPSSKILPSNSDIVT